MTVLGFLFIAFGALGPIAGVQWRQGRWLESGKWIVHNFSDHFLVGIPTAGIFVMSLGLSFIWPPATILAFLAAGVYVWVLFASVSRAEAEAAPAERPTRRDEAPRVARRERPREESTRPTAPTVDQTQTRRPPQRRAG